MAKMLFFSKCIFMDDNCRLLLLSLLCIRKYLIALVVFSAGNLL